MADRSTFLTKTGGLGSKVWGGALLLCIGGFLAVWPFIPPRLPGVVRLATGPADGSYNRFGEALRDELAESGVTLELVPTSGSVENIELLLSTEEDVDLALVQSGCIQKRDEARLPSVAALFYEPVLFFYEAGRVLDSQTQLTGWRIAVGEVGSGTRDLATLLLERQTGIDRVEIGGPKAVEALLAGEVDAAAFVTSLEVPWLRPLFENPRFQFYAFEQADALTRHYRFLTRITIPKGLVDLGGQIPPEDVEVIATTTSLVMRESAHSGLIPVLIESCRNLVSQGSLLAAPGTFPSPYQVDAPLHEDAARYFRRGPSLFHRYFPFQIASLLSRLSILILPLLTLLYPLIKSAGPVYRWLVLRRIYRWYRVLRAIENEMDGIQGAKGYSQLREEIGLVRAEVRETQVPVRFAADLYQVRHHIRILVERLDQLEREATMSTDPA